MLAFLPMIIAASAPAAAPALSARVTVVARAVILEGQRVRMGVRGLGNKALPKPRRGLVEFQ
jgi:hypothetical protein